MLSDGGGIISESGGRLFLGIGGRDHFGIRGRIASEFAHHGPPHRIPDSPQQVVAGLFVERLEPPIIQYQELNMAQGSLQAGVAAITTRERKLGKKPWDTLIEN